MIMLKQGNSSSETKCFMDEFIQKVCFGKEEWAVNKVNMFHRCNEDSSGPEYFRADGMFYDYYGILSYLFIIFISIECIQDWIVQCGLSSSKKKLWLFWFCTLVILSIYKL